MKPRMVATSIVGSFFSSFGLVPPELRARQLLRRIKVGRDHKWTDPDLAIEVGTFLRQTCFDVVQLVVHTGFHVHFRDLGIDPASGRKILGHHSAKEHVITVCRSTMDYYPLFRTTVLHELAHLLLHRHGQNPESRCEREANEFMQSAILPRAVLFLGVFLICQSNVVDPVLALQSANLLRGKYIWRHRLLPWLVDNLCVSRELIAILMEKEGWFDSATLQYHTSYHMPNKWLQPRTVEQSHVDSPWSNGVPDGLLRRVPQKRNHSCFRASLTSALAS